MNTLISIEKLDENPIENLDKTLMYVCWYSLVFIETAANQLLRVTNCCKYEIRLLFLQELFSCLYNIFKSFSCFIRKLCIFFKQLLFQSLDFS